MGSRNVYYSSFFDTWSPSMAYILGFIFADGNVHKNKLTFFLSSDDKEVLEYITSCISPTQKLYIRPPYQSINRHTGKTVYHKEAVQLSLSNKSMIENLSKLGIIENKTELSTSIPDVPEKYFYHFLRGIIDGDGCIYGNKTKIGKNGKLLKPFIRFNITSNHSTILEQLKDMSTKKGTISHCNHTSGGTSYQWQISNREDVLEILDKVYHNKEDSFWLTRKYNKLQQYIEDTIEYNKQISADILLAKNNLSNGLRICIRCLKTKSLSEFYRDSTNINGNNRYCKTCRRMMDKKYRDKKKELV